MSGPISSDKDHPRGLITPNLSVVNDPRGGPAVRWLRTDVITQHSPKTSATSWQQQAGDTAAVAKPHPGRRCSAGSKRVRLHPRVRDVAGLRLCRHTSGPDGVCQGNWPPLSTRESVLEPDVGATWSSRLYNVHPFACLAVIVAVFCWTTANGIHPRCEWKVFGEERDA